MPFPHRPAEDRRQLYMVEVHGLKSSVDSAMNRYEDRDEEVPPFKTTLCGEYDTQTKARSLMQQQRPGSPGPGPGPDPGPGPEHSCVSMRSDASMEPPLVFRKSADRRIHQQSSDSTGPGPEHSCVSMKSDASMEPPLAFRHTADGRSEI
ncbi:uncharacterized protein LOC119030177 isoform X2 [Acanthopagrus latus]|uniref:uncharacterized protein LOC119030177 isoform X2 n=1 Tax=Acanthopagrus latus TaxID=8177 RepID=UPI00187C2009|nr:uncharacterized protein LOC119030177 isoform X2 [Acanthopagrus latus]